jgi:hypothetical protein
VGAGLAFPVWVFDDVPVQSYFQIGGTVTTYFVVDVAGADARSSVWAHGLDQRPLVPEPVNPEAIAPPAPDSVDTLIEIVWPHDQRGRPAPVGAAPLVKWTCPRRGIPGTRTTSSRRSMA